MKILKKIIIFFGIAFLVLLVFLAATFLVIKHLKIKELVENQIEESLGINVSIDKITFSPLLAHVKVQGITVHNPDGFEEKELAYIESIHFVFDPVEMLVSEKPNIYLFAIDLARLNIVKSKDGKVNIKEIAALNDTSTAKSEGT
ncbi:MAG: AsmA family protein, partial [Candidatus Omnitrophica bacterium]|nr:AsmA family protein [Candidatus Omnitrophota bacterium]